MKRNEILGEHKKGTKAVKYNKKPKDHAAEFGKAKEKLAPVKPMEGYERRIARFKIDIRRIQRRDVCELTRDFLKCQFVIFIYEILRIRPNIRDRLETRVA